MYVHNLGKSQFPYKRTLDYFPKKSPYFKYSRNGEDNVGVFLLLEDVSIDNEFEF